MRGAGRSRCRACGGTRNAPAPAPAPVRLWTTRQTGGGCGAASSPPGGHQRCGSADPPPQHTTLPRAQAGGPSSRRRRVWTTSLEARRRGGGLPPTLFAEFCVTPSHKVCSVQQGVWWGGGVGGGRWPRTEDIRRLKGWLAGFRRRCPRHARCEPFTVAGYLLEMGLRAAAPSCGGALAAAPAGSAWQRDISRRRGAPPGRAGASAVASQHEVYFMCCPCPRPICTTIAPQQGSPPFASRLGGTPRPSRATGQVCGLLASVALLFADWPTNLSLLLGWRHPRAPIGRPATLGHTVALVGGPRGGGGVAGAPAGLFGVDDAAVGLE